MSKLFLLLLVCASLPAQPREKNLRELGEDGDMNAQVLLGNIFFYGEGAIARDEVEAFKWYLRAAKQGSALGQYAVGNAFFDGLVVEQDFAESVRWYRLAAEQGDPWAQTSLGYAYQEALGVPRNDAEAERWYRTALAQGNLGGRRLLLLQYLRGRAKPQSGESVLELFEKMEQETDPEMLALIATSVTLAGRSGMPRDVETAMRVAKDAHLKNTDIVMWFGDLYLRETDQAARLREGLKQALAGGQEQVVAFLEDFDSAVPNR